MSFRPFFISSNLPGYVPHLGANSSYYLKKNGLVMLAIKSQSIDSISKSEKIYNQEKNKLVNAGYEVVESIDIHKYAANHIVLLVKKIN